MTCTLLKNGTALLHGESDRISAVPRDILIRGNKIVRIAESIDADAVGGTEVVDCTNKIISPGFVDTHHHLWQTQLKGRHANETLLQYMISGNWQASNFSDEDFFWGQLGGCMEAVWAGTTTVVDHAHMNERAQSSRTAISATVASGLRSIFCYCPGIGIAKWNPVEFNPNILQPWVMETFEKLVNEGPYGDGRVTLGLAFDLYFLGQQVTTDIFQKAKSLGVQTITSHSVGGVVNANASLPQTLQSYGLLDESILISHANKCSERDAELVRRASAHISSTPSTELQMGLGLPECYREDLQSHASLGIDCHANNLGSIVSEMRVGLQAARAHSHAKFEALNKTPKRVFKAVEEAFNLGTIQGARAVRMGNEIGSLQEGKLADLVIFDATTPSMVGAAEHDPVAAVVLHSTPGDIDAVMIGGIWRKRRGHLLPVQVEAVAQAIVGVEQLEWSQVVVALQKTRKAIQEKIDKLDMEQAGRTVIETFRVDPESIVDAL